MILSTLVTSQLHFEMCAGLYGHPVCFQHICVLFSLHKADGVTCSYLQSLKAPLFVICKERQK